MKCGDIGKQIVFLREKRGYSQKDFAELIPVSQPTLSRWENGSIIPSLQQLERVCQVAGYSLEELFDVDKERYEKMVARVTRQKRIIVLLFAAVVLISLCAFFVKL